MLLSQHHDSHFHVYHQTTTIVPVSHLSPPSIHQSNRASAKVQDLNFRTFETEKICRQPEHGRPFATVVFVNGKLFKNCLGNSIQGLMSLFGGAGFVCYHASFGIFYPRNHIKQLPCLRPLPGSILKYISFGFAGGIHNYTFNQSLSIATLGSRT
ncbi:hypothetical protein FPOAC1_008505 [Fusarium poae]|uniref:hypothetical protein n=1 Tax=Fusarium poae TaxID=36050 RepID=UPI001CEBD202|nr:hypothetical protein FPOAC1_008505 [Fusarium poae]KAG8669117.1 hypothetical protein FPOAC1_008505 [Fusarium poae]